MEKKDQIQEKFINQLSKSFSGIVLASVRLGKCRVILKAIQQHSKNYIDNPKILVLYPIVNVKNSWGNECDLIDYHPNITYCTYLSIDKVMDENWDYIVGDEIHLCGEEIQLPKLGELICRHANTVLASGTINENTLEAIQNHTKLDLVINYPVEEAIKDGIVSDYSVFIYEFELDNTIKIEFGKKKKWMSTELKECNRLSNRVNTTFGQEKMFASLTRMHYINKCPSLVKTVNNWIEKNNNKRFILFTGDENVGKNYNIPMYNSKSKDEQVLQDFQNGIINQLCLIKKGAMGTTYPMLDNVLITAINSNSENLFQMIGRALLDDTEHSNIHIFVSNQSFQQNWLNKAISDIPKEKITWKTCK